MVLSEFSEFGLPDSVMKPDLLAPGAGMVAVGSKGKFKVGSGTSYATPLIAGLVSCLWSKNPEFDGSSILSLLFGLLSDAGSPGPDVRYGRGKIDPEKLSVILSDILS